MTRLLHITSLLFLAAASLNAEFPKAEQDRIVKQLGAEKWSDRNKAGAEANVWAKEAFNAFAERAVLEMGANPEPEIRLQMRAVLKTSVIETYYYAQGFLGIQMGQSVVPFRMNNQEYHPVDISQVLPDCAAIKHNMRAGDRILEIDGKACHRIKFPVTKFTEYIRSKKPGDKVKITYQSAGQMMTKEIVLGTRPENLNPKTLGERQEEFFVEWLSGFQEDPEAAEKEGP